MNCIEVRGGKAYQKEYVKSVVEFCIKMLMPRMKSLDIEVVLKDLKGDAYGYCLSETTREFEIEIDRKLPLRKLLTTVAHEMVHVKQYARRELHGADGQVWLGKHYNTKKVSYWDQPWEIEAHGRETGLFVRWAEEHKLAHKKWTQDD
jgi:hypothetical protein